MGIVPQSGNTGLVGGQIPFETGHDIVVSTNRLTAIRATDPSGRFMTVEAGITLADVHRAAEAVDRQFPLSLASEGSCRIGGNLATNAGGVHVLSYGSARDLVLGLEVVLPDGKIWDGLRGLKKDNAGYDLKDLFVGSEGTLGIITAAVLKLVPRPAEQATALVAVRSLEAALGLSTWRRRRAGGCLTAFEFMSAFSLDLVTRHIPGRSLPLAGQTPWMVLLELSSGVGEGRAAAAVEEILTAALDGGLATDAVVAQSLQQREALWHLRDSISEAQKHEGGSIKHDISVAVSRIPDFVARADAVVQRVCPGARPVVFGHMGDGNVHYNVTQPPGMDKSAYLAQWDAMNEAVHRIVADLDGSISAEHGIGRLKRAILGRYRSPVELDLMRTIKAAIDPNGIMNPGKLL